MYVGVRTCVYVHGVWFVMCMLVVCSCGVYICVCLVFGVSNMVFVYAYTDIYMYLCCVWYMWCFCVCGMRILWIHVCMVFVMYVSMPGDCVVYVCFVYGIRGVCVCLGCMLYVYVGMCGVYGVYTCMYMFREGRGGGLSAKRVKVHKFNRSYYVPAPG